MIETPYVQGSRWLIVRGERQGESMLDKKLPRRNPKIAKSPKSPKSPIRSADQHQSQEM